MNLNFFEYGDGDVREAVDYVVSDYDHEGNPRVNEPIIHSGNPDLLIATCDGISRKYKYTSGVIREDGILDDDLKQHIMDSFEDYAFAGLEKDQYQILWVEHNDHDATELHFVIARTELTTGRDLNIAPPGHEKFFKPWRDEINIENNLARPDIPVNTVSHPRFENTTQRENREIINDIVENSYRLGNINSRDDVINKLQDAGFEINREGKNYISVISPELDKPVRLKGGLYDKSNWENNQLERTSEQSEEARRDRDIEQLAEAIERRVRNTQARAERHERTYEPAKPADERTNRSTREYAGSNELEAREERSELGREAEPKLEQNNQAAQEANEEIAQIYSPSEQSSSIDSDNRKMVSSADSDAVDNDNIHQLTRTNGIEPNPSDINKLNQQLDNEEVEYNGINHTRKSLTRTVTDWFKRTQSTITNNVSRLCEAFTKSSGHIEPENAGLREANNNLVAREEYASGIVGDHQEAIQRTLEYFKGTDGKEYVNDYVKIKTYEQMMDWYKEHGTFENERDAQAFADEVERKTGIYVPVVFDEPEPTLTPSSYW